MISLFYDLKEEGKFSYDIDQFIETYSFEYLKLNKNFNFYYEKYTSIQNTEIHKSLSEELSSYETTEPVKYDIQSTDKVDTLFMKSCLLESLKKVVEIKNKKTKESKKESESDKYKRIHKYHYYPDLEDYNDYEKYLQDISLRKEFAFHSIPKERATMDSKCNPTSFQLAPHQLFLKNLFNIDTPYNGILIFHGVGVGKTCSGVSIAENFKHLENKTIILASEKIQVGWKKNIFDPKKGDNQCTGEEYKYEEDKYERNIEGVTEKRIKEFYEMSGYLSFANKVKGLLEDNLKIIPSNEIQIRKEREIEIIKKNYSNRVLIIDEVHNIRNDEDKKSSKENIRDTIYYIEKVIKYSDNLKLILLTANPMFNHYNEIVWILNMLLMNDNREIIKNNIIFDEKNELTKESHMILREKSRGYISYLRGENPFTFPIRLYPQDEDKLLVKGFEKDIFQKAIDPLFNLTFLKLYKAPLKGIQRKRIKAELNNLEETIKISDESKLLQLSNCYYPSNSEDIEDLYGKNGFSKCFTSKGRPAKYSYKKNVPNFLDLDQLKNYSSKIYNIIKNINKSDGIAFIYSNYLEGGVLPILLALEQNGYKHCSDNEIFQSKDKRESISYEGKLKSKYKEGEFKQARYMVISGSFESGLNLTQKNFKKEIELVTSKENKNGEIIKVIIGSTMAAEGLDFKNIRSIHLLEPWHNINKLEQVIGRGIRNCSHIMLDDPKYRNVTIYLYTTIIEDRETIETYLYRRCEIKSKQIGQIELLLKDMAIDKYLFRNANIIQEEDVEEVEVKPSYRKHESFSIKPFDRDGEYSRSCSFLEDCNYLKNRDFKINENIETLRKDTFSIKYSQELIHIYKKKISELISEEFYLNYEDIQSRLDDLIENKIDEFIIHALSQMVSDKYPITSINGVKGYLVYSDNYYLFQPDNNSDIFLPLYYRLNNGIIDKNEYIIEDTNISRINIPEIQSFSKEQIENKINEIKYKKLSSREEYVFKMFKELDQKRYLYLRYIYIIDRVNFKDKCLLLYSLLEYLLGDSDVDSKYNDFFEILKEFYQKLFIYNETNYEWHDVYTEDKSINLYGGFLYFHQKKEYKFFNYNSKRLILCNIIRNEDIENDFRLIKQNDIFNPRKKTYGFIEYNRNYRLIQGGNIMKIKRNKDRSGIVFISSSGSEWSSENAIKFIQKEYSDIFSSLNKKYKESLSEISTKGKLKTHKLVFGVLIEMCFRISDRFIQGDLLWLYNYTK